MVLTVIVDLFVLRTRLVRTRAFWISLAIMCFFQIFVDGWLTRARDTIVFYNPDDFSGIRVFFHTPIEDFGFGFALILATLSVWEALSHRVRSESSVGEPDRADGLPGDSRGDGADLGGGAPAPGARDRVGTAP
ncbi:MAG: lycopene cyclase domain-containing protein [Acidimicrobiales bacterium]|nr:lycopene cyclase domain-containing protein [Acidimicrobiales bacterium]